MLKTELTAEIAKSIKETRGLLLDLDKTLIDKKAAEVSFRLIKKEKELGHYANVARGYVGGLEVYVGTSMVKAFKGEVEGDNWGLKKLHQILRNSKIHKKEINDIALTYMKNHEIEGAKSCMNVLSKFGYPKKMIITTGSASVFAEPAVTYFGADDYTANETQYTPDGLIKGVEIIMENPKKRLEATRRKTKEHGLELGECMLVTDNLTDSVFKNHVRILVSGPLAKELKYKSDLHILSYPSFESQIRRF